MVSEAGRMSRPARRSVASLSERAAAFTDGLLGVARGERPVLLRFLLVALVAQAVPGVAPELTVLVVDLALVYAVAAIGLNVIFGLGGLASIGQASIMAAGAYTFAILLGRGYGVGMAFICAALAGALLSVGMGLLGSRLKTHYFILASLVFAEVVLLVVKNDTGLTGGANGMAVLGGDLGTALMTPSTFFRVGIVAVLVAAYGADALRCSRMGVAMSSLTMSEVTGLASGVRPWTTRLVATAAGGLCGSVAGTMLALLNGYIGPDDFGLGTAALLLVIVVVGGRGRSGSVILAALALTYLSHGLVRWQGVGPLVYGVGLIALLIFAPDGVYGAATRVRGRLGAAHTTSGGGGQ